MPEIDSPRGEKSPALRIRGMRKTFPGVQALKGVDLDIDRSSVHAILGHNGCGKSTLIKTLAGVHSPDPGSEVWIDGTPLPLDDPTASERLGLRFVHQELGLILELGAVDNIGLALGYRRGSMRRIDWKSQARAATELLARFDVDIDPMRPLAEATPPQRTAVAIVRAVADWQPGQGVLVLDEPTAALPAPEVDRLFGLIRTVRDSGSAVALVSHRLDEVMEIADYASVMRAGEVIWAGPTADTDIDVLVGLIAGDNLASPVEQGGRPTNAPRLSSAKTLLKVDGLDGDYLRGLNMTIKEGEILGVAGLLGSGREELPYILAGARGKPRNGRIEVEGKEVGRLSVQTAQEHGIVLVPGDRATEGLIPEFSTRENVSLAALPKLASIGGVKPAKERRFAAEWLASVGADPTAASRQITTLSGGNQQKAVLARWLSVSPRLILMAEPTAGVDVGARSLIYREIRDRAEKGLSFLVCSSDVDDLLAVCDRVLVLKDGMVVAQVEGVETTKQKIIAATEGLQSEHAA